MFDDTHLALIAQTEVEGIEIFRGMATHNHLGIKHVFSHFSVSCGNLVADNTHSHIEFVPCRQVLPVEGHNLVALLEAGLVCRSARHNAVKD